MRERACTPSCAAEHAQEETEEEEEYEEARAREREEKGRGLVFETTARSRSHDLRQTLHA